MRKWSFTFLAMSFVAGMLTGCRSFCHTAGVCDCDFAMDDPCCHRAPWVSGPCLPNYNPNAIKGGCANGNCGNGNCAGGNCGSGAYGRGLIGRGGCIGNCATGNCATGNCPNGACAPASHSVANGNGPAPVVTQTTNTPTVTVPAPNKAAPAAYPVNFTSAQGTKRSLIQIMRERAAVKNGHSTQYAPIHTPTNGSKEIIAITPPAHAPSSEAPPFVVPAPIGND